MHADKFNKYFGIGPSDTNACAACFSTGTRVSNDFTSLAGAAYCTVPYVDFACGNGQEYDPSSESCVTCAAGTYRTVGSQDVCTPW